MEGDAEGKEGGERGKEGTRGVEGYSLLCAVDELVFVGALIAGLHSVVVPQLLSMLEELLPPGERQEQRQAGLRETNTRHTIASFLPPFLQAVFTGHTTQSFSLPEILIKTIKRQQGETEKDNKYNSHGSLKQ